MSRSPHRLCLMVALGLAGVSLAAAPPPPKNASEPAALVGDAPKAAEKEEEKPDPFHSRTRYGLNWIISHGPKRFDVIEWVSRPDMLTLADLVSWRCKDEFDLNAWLNFDIRWWAGPQGNPDTVVPNLPPRVYDLNLYFTWRQHWTEGVATEVTLLPGLYTDFRTTPPEAFRVPGFAVGVFRVAPDWHLVAGVQHLQRVRVKVLPIVGMLWEPDDRLQCRFVFPEPKVSYHLDAKADMWVYARGEYGGGTWAFKDDLGHGNLVDYSDVRVAAGFEWGSLSRTFWPKCPLGTGFFEVGYVFDRSLAFWHGMPTTNVPAGWMLSLGGTW